MSAVPEIINPLGGTDWDTLVQSHPEAGLCHESRWLRVLQRSLRVQPFCCVLRRSDGSPRAGMPGALVASPLTGRRLSALPLSEFADPLVEDAADLLLLLKAFRGHGESQQAPSAQLRTRNPLLAEAVEGWTLDDSCVRHVISLEGSHNRGNGSLQARHPAQRRPGARSWLEAQEGTRRCDAQDLPSPPRLYTHPAGAVAPAAQVLPSHARSFRQAPAGVGRRDHWWDSHREQSGHLCRFHLLRLYAGSNHQFHNLRPNHLLNEAEMALAGEMGLKWYDYGRTQRDNRGLRKFKERWGAEALPMYTYNLGSHVKPGTARHSLARRFVPLIPYPAAALAGRLAYPHLC